MPGCSESRQAASRVGDGRGARHPARRGGHPGAACHAARHPTPGRPWRAPHLSRKAPSRFSEPRLASSHAGTAAARLTPDLPAAARVQRAMPRAISRRGRAVLRRGRPQRAAAKPRGAAYLQRATTRAVPPREQPRRARRWSAGATGCSKPLRAPFNARDCRGARHPARWAPPECIESGKEPGRPVQHRGKTRSARHQESGSYQDAASHGVPGPMGTASMPFRSAPGMLGAVRIQQAAPRAITRLDRRGMLRIRPCGAP